MSQNKPTRYIFPVGELKYIHAVRADDKFNPQNPDYNVTMVYPAAEGKRIVADLEQLVPTFKGRIPFKRDNDDNYIFKAKQRSRIEFKDRETGEPTVIYFKPVLKFEGKDYEGAEPWGGSTGEVATQLAITKVQGRDTLAIRLKGIRFHDIKIGDGSSEGDDGNDDLFAGNFESGAPKAALVVIEAEDDDVPFN